MVKRWKFSSVSRMALFCFRRTNQFTLLNTVWSTLEVFLMRSCQFFQSHLLYWVLTYFTVCKKRDFLQPCFQSGNGLEDIFGKSPSPDCFSLLLFLALFTKSFRTITWIRAIAKWLYDINYAIAIASLSVMIFMTSVKNCQLVPLSPSLTTRKS